MHHIEETGGVIQDAEIPSGLVFCFFFLLKLWNLVLWMLFSLGSLELWSWSSHLCGASQHLSIFSLEGCAHFPPPSGVSHKTPGSWEFDLQIPGCQILLYHNKCGHLNPVSSVHATLQNLVASDTGDKSKNTKAEMWQVTVSPPPPCTHSNTKTILYCVALNFPPPTTQNKYL